ncbi:phosphatidylinositol kinase- protein kinase tor1, partial [Perkinsus olseni]
IQTYAVVPLSNNSGLIEWVPGSDTIHKLIKDYRDANNIPLSVEYSLMKGMYGRCEELSLLQKVEVLRYALDNTSGDDLERVMWLQSRNSEVWLRRRGNYSRSLAVMSVVGYVLGLGDRHPSNIMIEQDTGKVVHIDFGDCFE